MERRFNRNLSNEGLGRIGLQKQLAENRRARSKNVPDLTDFMNDMFFGTANTEKKAYNLTGREDFLNEDDFDSSRRSVSNSSVDFDSSRRSISSNMSADFDSSRRSVSSRSTQEWLEEAKRMVAQSPSRCDSPVRLAGSPRFATSKSNLSSTSIEKRDPLSRSARRHRSVDGFSGDILSRTAKHNNNRSEATLDPQLAEASPASAVQKWFTNILKPQNGLILNPNPSNPPVSSDPTSEESVNNPPVPPLPPRQLTPRKSRFQTNPNATQTHPIPPPTNHPTSKRTFKTASSFTNTTTNSPKLLDTQLLSPPKHLIQSSHRRSISSSTCLVNENQVLSPPRNLVESAHRRSVSATTCCPDRILPKTNVDSQPQEEVRMNQDLNVYLKEQREKIWKIMSGEINGKAKIVLSEPTNSTSSMVAAICYAWLLQNRMRLDKDRAEGDGTNGEVVVPVMNMRRGKMWKQRQAAWLFHHVELDTTALLFSDEVELEKLMMTKRLSILVVGQDILKTNGEVGSGCTVLTDNYCEDAYDLLQTPTLKKLLLAGILVDTQNLNASIKLSMTRDAEAIQLLLVGSSPSYRNTLYDQLMQDQRDDTFTEVLQQNYGRPPSQRSSNKDSPAEHRPLDKHSNHKVITSNEDKSPKDVKKVVQTRPPRIQQANLRHHQQRILQ